MLSVLLLKDSSPLTEGLEYSYVSTRVTIKGNVNLLLTTVNQYHELFSDLS